ncbi:hypothetical protein VTL71DRAFT_6409 [Oculimacula yallundae]|uniref:Uncharacterized protein n=1 Tax=Oculimacula yallundae TaxID=86028 RepID=A0ABR4BWW2_9HELO
MWASRNRKYAQAKGYVPSNSSKDREIEGVCCLLRCRDQRDEILGYAAHRKTLLNGGLKFVSGNLPPLFQHSPSVARYFIFAFKFDNQVGGASFTLMATIFVFLLATLGSSQYYDRSTLQVNGLAISEFKSDEYQPSVSKYSVKVPVAFGQQTHILKRQASDSIVVEFEHLSEEEKLGLYAKAIIRGGCWLQQLQGSIEDADAAIKMNGKTTSSQSRWTSYDTVAAWGWAEDEDYQPVAEDTFASAYADQQIETRNDFNLELEQNKELNYPGPLGQGLYKASEGFYRAVYNVAGGSIIADHNESPGHANDQKARKDRSPIVHLNTWADLTFLVWQKQAGQNVKNIKHIFRSLITNKETKYYMLKAILDSNNKLGNYKDRVIFTKDGIEGALPGDQDQGNGLRAILASPNGKGVFWFLQTHKAQLGLKTIEKVAIWVEDDLENHNPMDKWDYSFCMHIQLANV